jgi:hypothetical protein
MSANDDDIDGNNTEKQDGFDERAHQVSSSSGGQQNT